MLIVVIFKDTSTSFLPRFVHKCLELISRLDWVLASGVVVIHLGLELGALTSCEDFDLKILFQFPFT